MKNILLIVLMLGIVASAANAQKTVTDTAFIVNDDDFLYTPVKDSANGTPQLLPLRKQELLPNFLGKSLMTPTAWGGYKNFVFANIGGTFPQTYANRGDMVATIGGGIGNSKRMVSVIGFINMNDVSAFGNYSGNLVVSRHLYPGSSLSIGALHLFPSARSDMGPSYYAAFSHAVQSLPSKIQGRSKLNYTIGVGSGRFEQKSLKDMETGKGEHGTIVFGNIAYEIHKSINIVAEWTGLNLALDFGWRPSLKLPSFNFGLADITRFSGDKMRFVFSIGYAYSFPTKR